MIPINNSDTAWLIIADYNQDNDIGYPDALREDVISPNVNDWEWTLSSRYGANRFGGDYGIGGVYPRGVGAGIDDVGAGDSNVGSDSGGLSNLVGDNEEVS